ncbi:ABC transporter ATP-binding protein [Kribbella sandramycini]|uniref:ABC transporter ATP-binding protein n=1 Tax=Kribbella sandramycini TaxID=60450 RepID=A0A7Y4P3J3_9ACTN|nr:ABC transporter ATP-binding protein [Kribbella sandramycini]MBB6566123.1 iron complex transport system ATP-binding protein [Kribbella sandramycini]NOL45123.1 ABC transporter ATP-binding protein [Kribbella sandramycini]
MSELRADTLTLAYDGRVVVHELSVLIPRGQITVIVGANASGKSTLLRGLARLLKPHSGTVYLDDTNLATLSGATLATRLGMLPQQPVAPDGITVSDLVGRGRHPYQKWFRQWTPADEQAVHQALQATGTADLADRPLDELSGGQRQRVWLSLALAQDAQTMLLDEPTTFLDLAHQLEILDLVRTLNRSHRKTIVLVLHDLNLAARYADHLIALKSGHIAATGTPTQVITPTTVHSVFNLPAQIIPDPQTNTPLVIPIPRD